MNTQTVATEKFDVISAANKISGSLGHYHTLETTDGLETARELQDAWIAAGTARAEELYSDPRNRDLYQGALAPGITGWHEVATDDQEWPSLGHTTQSGRLSVAVKKEGVFLEFEAGPAKTAEEAAHVPQYPGEYGSTVYSSRLRPGRPICTVAILPDGKVNCTWEPEGKALVAESPGRLGLLSDINRSLDGVLEANSDDEIIVAYLRMSRENRADYNALYYPLQAGRSITQAEYDTACKRRNAEFVTLIGLPKPPALADYNVLLEGALKRIEELVATRGEGVLVEAMVEAANRDNWSRTGARIWKMIDPKDPDTDPIVFVGPYSREPWIMVLSPWGKLPVIGATPARAFCLAETIVSELEKVKESAA